MDSQVLAFLLMFHCSPQAQLLTVPDLPYRGFYRDGVVQLRPDADTGVLVHELFHACQEQRRGKAGTEGEWRRREEEAKGIEGAWRNFQ